MQRMVGNQYRTTIVCIDSYLACVPKGWLFNPAMDGGKSFDSLMQFLLEMENLLNEVRFPQPFMMTRRFSSQGIENVPTCEGGGPQTGKLATFAVKVLFRQNASWQGIVTWLNGNQEESFRSTLELILLMHSALSEENSEVKQKSSEESILASN